MNAQEDFLARCPACRETVNLTNLRSWPNGVLVIGDCPRCGASIASSRPVGWSDPRGAVTSEPAGAGS